MAEMFSSTPRWFWRRWASACFQALARASLPLSRASNSDPNRALKSGVSAGTARSHNRLRASFVITQIALSLVLVVFSGLLLLTLRRMLQVDLGLNPKNLLMLGI